MTATDSNLPVGSAPPALAFPHFPSRLYAYVWRNWPLVPLRRLAAVVGAREEDIRRLAAQMGLQSRPDPTADQWRRSYIPIIRRNWHLLPYPQLLELLEWSESRLAYTLLEDDFLFIKLGSLKPQCPLLQFSEPDEKTVQRAGEIAVIVREEFPHQVPQDPLFSFVERLSRPISSHQPPLESKFSPRFCYSYFALYGDPLLEKEADPYPDGYLSRLARSGVDGVWLQALLSKLAPFPWDPTLSERYQDRLRQLHALVSRGMKHGIGFYLYLNEPRALPLSFFDVHPDLKGVTEGDHAALCTSHPAAAEYITQSVASICQAVPELAGFFTITASENLTNCWSHGAGERCPRCKERGAAEVVAGVNHLVQNGIERAGGKARLIAWDWGWPDNQAADIIHRLPSNISLMSVSEWSIPLRRGGIESIVGEYSLSAVGPGPRALGHWKLARRRGLHVIAKIQAANSWELSSIPYIPVTANTARHAANLRDAGVDGLMLGWTLGGYPSPNLEVVAEIGRKTNPPSPEAAMQRVAGRHFGEGVASEVVRAWEECSAAFEEFPFHIGVVYTAPLQMGPSNLLWEKPSGYHATMVGIPYDDLDAWRSVYPPEIFIQQLRKVADGFQGAAAALGTAMDHTIGAHAAALQEELNLTQAAALHFCSVSNQARFVLARNGLAAARTPEDAHPHLNEVDQVLQSEIDLSRRLYHIQCRDSRIGFEASNQYYYIPQDLMEKVLNCRDLMDRWLKGEKEKWRIFPAANS